MVNINKETKFNLSLELLVMFTVCIFTLGGIWYSLSTKMANLQDAFLQQQTQILNVECQITKINEVQLLTQIQSNYKTQDRWTGSMQAYWQSRLMDTLQELHPDKNVRKMMVDADVVSIQAKYPLADLHKTP